MEKREEKEFLGYAYLPNNGTQEIALFEMLGDNDDQSLKLVDIFEYVSKKEYEEDCDFFSSDCHLLSRGFIGNESNNAIDIYAYYIGNNQKIIVSEYDKKSISYANDNERRKLEYQLVQEGISSLKILFNLVDYLQSEEEKERRRTMI